MKTSNHPVEIGNSVNTAMAALALLASGTDAVDTERALLEDPHVPGRMERVDVITAAGLGLPLVVVASAHTPAEGAAALQVDWRPPARGDEKLAGILARMRAT